MSTALADHGPRHPGEADTTCQDVLDGEPGYELEQATDPPDGSTVRAGDVIEVRMTWKADDFADGPLHNALNCVTVDGRLETALSLVGRDAANDGEVTHRFTVPAGLPAGAPICARGAIAGDGNGYFELNKSTDNCFKVAADSPSEQAPAPGPPPAPPPPAQVPPASPPASPAPPPAEAAPVSEVAPPVVE
ncbi:MAG: hypothetical protein M3357_19455, partial [Actinomycetota bacterium]|nr:hypothetical protein [Actinomycetota bacterium]